MGICAGIYYVGDAPKKDLFKADLQSRRDLGLDWKIPKSTVQNGYLGVCRYTEEIAKDNYEDGDACGGIRVLKVDNETQGTFSFYTNSVPTPFYMNSYNDFVFQYVQEYNPVDECTWNKVRLMTDYPRENISVEKTPFALEFGDTK
jgi:hypothetical protein